MSSPASNKTFTLRSALITSQTEENNTDFVLNKAWGSAVTLQLEATIGSATTITFKYYVSMDQVTYYPIEALGGGVVSHAFTANGTKVVNVAAPGWSYLRCGVVSAGGAITSSSATVKARYITRAV